MQRWIIGVAALAALLATGRLGLWQLERAHAKLALHETVQRQREQPELPAAQWPRHAGAAAAHEHRRVRLAGHWLAEHSIYLENRQMNGRPGFFVVTPLRLDTGETVLVQRGWTVRDGIERRRIVAPAPTAGPVEIEGRLALRVAALAELGASEPGSIRQNLDQDAFARETGLALLPFVVVQEEGALAPTDGLLRHWPAPAAGVDKHYGYAFQWFALAALVAGLYVWFQLIGSRRRRAG